MVVAVGYLAFQLSEKTYLQQKSFPNEERSDPVQSRKLSLRQPVSLMYLSIVY